MSVLAFLVCWRDVRQGIRNGLADAAVRRGDLKRALAIIERSDRGWDLVVEWTPRAGIVSVRGVDV